MEKNNTLITILIIAIVVVGGYYFYQKGTFSGSSVDIIAGQECFPVGTVVADGAFDRIEGGIVYFYPKGEDSLMSVLLTEETVFSRIVLSLMSEVIEQGEIESSSIKNGDSVSVTVYCGDEVSDEKSAQEIRLIVSQLPEVNSPAESE
ncbi:MAG: hypothetical protein ABH889_00420 [Candidatus Portnoybacteria bacterium]